MVTSGDGRSPVCAIVMSLHNLHSAAKFHGAGFFFKTAVAAPWTLSGKDSSLLPKGDVINI